MIVFVAPYSPPGRTRLSHLGASRKIETVIKVLSRICQDVVLVNSAHNDNGPEPLKVCRSRVGQIEVTEITPPLFRSRSVGKLQNLFSVNRVLDILRDVGKPELFWFYNGYAFEMLFASSASRRFGAPMILELEDWHFSRKRGLNPKPFLDYVFWLRAARLFSGAFVVNTSLQTKMSRFVEQVKLLPGIVSRDIEEIGTSCKPFSTASERINIGYFSGLTTEKGADLVLGLAEMLPEGFTLQVTGAGPLSDSFAIASRKYPNTLRFHGVVTDITLNDIIKQCDVILNPHSSIQHMANGVFPFKVVEAVASGRLLLSSSLPTNSLTGLLRGVQFVDSTKDAFLAAITSSAIHYAANVDEILLGAASIRRVFNEDALLAATKAMMSRKRNAES